MTAPHPHHLALSINGRPTDIAVEARTTLADALRDACGLTGTKLGCEQGSCGACTVLYNGQQIRSCLLFAVQADGANVWTIEGLSNPPIDWAPDDVPLPKLNELASAFKRHHALQCGFCTPGMLIAGAALGHSVAEPLDNDQIRDGLSGNICRCTGYQGIVEAITETFSEVTLQPSGEAHT